jgi:hypothetical protein
LNALVDFRVLWLAGLNADANEALVIEREIISKEKGKAEYMAKLVATFKAIDTKNEGLIDESEFKDFIN